MTTKPRTIDNLGVDISVQYAKNMQELDRKFIEESRSIPFQTEVMATSPYIPSEWDELFSIKKKHLPWAQFFAPPKFKLQRRNLFSYQLIPSMGTFEKHLSEIEKLKHFQFRDKKRKKKNQELLQEKEEKEEEKERDILIGLLERISFLDKQILFVNSRRSQYQKG